LLPGLIHLAKSELHSVMRGFPGIQFLSAAVLSVVALNGCKPKQAPPQQRTMPPAMVGVVTVTPQNIPEMYEFQAQVEPSRRVEVRSRVDGIIIERPFREGSVVSRGQVLYVLDKVRYEAAYRNALARRDNAKRTLERLEPLLARHAVAQQEVDNARTDLEAASASLEQAKEDLDETVVRASINGLVGRARLELGARVTGPGDLLTTIDQLEPVYVVFHPSTQQLLQWRADPRSRALIQPQSRLAVRVILPDGSTLPRQGRLVFVSPTADSATGTQEFRAEFENRDRLFVPGQFVRVQLTGFTRLGALAVPQRAVQQGLGRQFVYVVGAGDTATARDVKTGPWSGDLWIIDQGLQPGDRVVVDGTQKVIPGSKVIPADASAGPPAGATPGAPPAARRPTDTTSQKSKKQ
jgi:membrane fusion protein, multidrug efflux system